MAVPSDPLLRIEGAVGIAGPAQLSAFLLDQAAAPNQEGPWIPWGLAKSSSVELTGSMSTVSVQIYGTNALAPTNSYAITIGGAATNNDVITLNFATPEGTLSVNTTVTTAETVTQMAAALVTAINTSASFAAFGMTASNLAGVITVTWPSYNPVGLPAFQSSSSPTLAPFVVVTSSVSGSATETVTVAVGSGGVTVGSAIVALGLTQITMPVRWIKARLTTLTGASASISAILQGTA